MSTSHTILLGGGNQLEQQGMKRLNAQLAKTGKTNLKGERSQAYSEMSTTAWRYWGAVADQQSAARMEQFCQTHQPFLARYQEVLEQLHTQLSEQTQATMRYCTTYNVASELDNFKADAKERLKTVVMLLNTHQEGCGYLFSGAQTDHVPVNPQVFDMLASGATPQIEAQALSDYITSGHDPEGQLPLMLVDAQKGLKDFKLPLEAADIQAVFTVFHDMLSLTPETAHEGVRSYQFSLEPSMEKIKNAVLEVSSRLNILETIETDANKAQESSAEILDTLNKASPFESSLAFYAATKALEVFLQYIVFLNASHERLRELTTPQLLR